MLWFQMKMSAYHPQHMPATVEVSSAAQHLVLTQTRLTLAPALSDTPWIPMA